MLNKSKDFNSNYALKIVRINDLEKHPNADRLQLFKIDGNTLITSNATKVGDIVIYFPALTKINEKFLGVNNQFRDSKLNVDKTASGFFESKGVVKPINLRGIKSQGFIMPFTSLEGFSNIEFSEDLLNKEFDSIDGQILGEKYIVPTKQSGMGKGPKNRKAPNSKLIDGQFRLHNDTEQLGKNLWKIKPSDFLAVTYKLHGTSVVISNVLCKKKLKWHEKMFKWLGLNVIDTEYSNIYSSRKVVKNSDLNPNANHFYDVDIWGKANDLVKDMLKSGESIYGEIVGWVPGGAMIQQGYDYGCEKGTFKLYIYKITQTNMSGDVIELDYLQVAERAKELGVEVVPLLYYGYASFLNPINSDDPRDFQEGLMDHIRTNWSNDEACYMCDSGVVKEGCCVKVEGYYPTVFKSKGFKFLEGEFTAINNNEGNIEDSQ